MGIEFQILDFIQGMSSPFLDKIMVFITSLGDEGAIWIVLAIILLIIPKTRIVGITLTVAMILDLLVCNVILKNIVARIRPFDINTSINLQIESPKDYSFPSGHTAVSVVATMVLYLSKYRVLWKITTVLTILISFSRMYLYVHFPTDILGGIIVGILIGYVAYKIVGVWDKKINKFPN